MNTTTGRSTSKSAGARKTTGSGSSSSRSQSTSATAGKSRPTTSSAARGKRRTKPDDPAEELRATAIAVARLPIVAGREAVHLAAGSPDT